MGDRIVHPRPLSAQAWKRAEPKPRQRHYGRYRSVDFRTLAPPPARLGEALKEMAVNLMLAEGKGRWG
ncbi:MAG: hypothetical protein ACYDB3_10115 [Acidimicrobiales bacterium]